MFPWDEEAAVYFAVCEGTGLVLESESYDKLIRRVKDALPELMELNNVHGYTSIRFLTGERHMALT